MCMHSLSLRLSILCNSLAHIAANNVLNKWFPLSTSTYRSPLHHWETSFCISNQWKIGMALKHGKERADDGRKGCSPQSIRFRDTQRDRTLRQGSARTEAPERASLPRSHCMFESLHRLYAACKSQPNFQAVVLPQKYLTNCIAPALNVKFLRYLVCPS